MNKSIEKLLNQALAEFTAENKHATIVIPDPLQRDFVEKFAQLIAQECARLAMTQHSSTSPDDYHDMEPYNQGCDNTASTISGLIRLTFGVDNTQVVHYTTETAQAQQQQKDTE